MIGSNEQVVGIESAEASAAKSFSKLLKDKERSNAIKLTTVQSLLTVLNETKDPNTIASLKNVLTEVMSGSNNPELIGKTAEILGGWGKDVEDPKKKLVVVEVLGEALNINTGYLLGVDKNRNSITFHDLAVEAVIKVGGSCNDNESEELPVVLSAINSLSNYIGKPADFDRPGSKSFGDASAGISLLRTTYGVKDLTNLNIKPPLKPLPTNK